MALKILSSLKKAVSIKMMIHERLAGWDKARPHINIHASDLMKSPEYCPREQVFLGLGLSKKRDSFIGTALRITFDHGRSMEHNLRNNWLLDSVVGEWQCIVCGHVHPTFGKIPIVKCPICNYANKWEYKETRILSPLSGVSGSIDAFIDVGQPKLILLEIKSMAPDEFKKLVAPLAEHKFRTALYLRLVAESNAPYSDRINTNEAHILYVSKSFGFKDETMKDSGIKDAGFSPLKEFIIKRDDSLTETAISKATTVFHYRSTGVGMPCGVCTSGLSKRAQQCSSVSPCFGGAYPSQITWLEEGAPRHQGKNLLPLISC